MQQSFIKHTPYGTPGKVRKLSLRETPAFRASYMPEACTPLELLAALIGGLSQLEIAETLLGRFGGDLRRLYNAPVEEITQVSGVGSTTASRLKAALALAVHMIKPTELPVINSPADAANLVMAEMGLLEKEHLRVILLNTRNHVLDIVEVYKGSVNSSQVRVGEVLRPAVQRNASAVIVAHNHPSKDPTPSPDDVAVTRAIVQAGKLMDVDVLDHLVIGQGQYISMKERGLGF